MLSTQPQAGDAPRIDRHEEFAGTIGEVLRLGWSGHFSAGQSVLVALRDRHVLSPGQRALCRALLALTAAALDDVGAARRLARQAISDSARPTRSTSPEELRWLRLARALASNASRLIGDIVRACRAAQAKFVLDDPDSQLLIRAQGATPWLEAPPAIQRYTRFVAAVHERHTKRSSGPLTPMELVVFHHLDAGLNAPSIATLLGRSPFTVRTHLRNAYARLGARGRMDALAKARALGLLEQSGPPR